MILARRREGRAPIGVCDLGLTEGPPLCLELRNCHLHFIVLAELECACPRLAIPTHSHLST
jgi:hypothetical protein